MINLSNNAVCDAWEKDRQYFTDGEVEELSDVYNLYMSRFKYDGDVPEELKKDAFGINQIDRILWNHRFAVLFRDEVTGLSVLPIARERDFNKNYLPTEWEVVGANGYRKKGLNADNSVIFYNDYSFLPPLVYVYRKVKAMLLAEESARANLRLQKFPFMFEGDENTLKSDKLFAQKIADNAIVFKRKGSKNSIEQTQYYNIKPNLEALELLRTRDKFINDILTYLGYNNVQIEKAERVNTIEASANAQRTNAHLTACLNARNAQFEQVERVFGNKIKAVPALLQDFEIKKGENNDNADPDDGALQPDGHTSADPD